MERMTKISPGKRVPGILREEARIAEADPEYRHPVVAMLILRIQKGGRKTVARRIVYGAMSFLKRRFPFTKPIELLLIAVGALRPRCEVRAQRMKGGARKLVGIAVPDERATVLAIREVAKKAREARGMSMSERLAHELGEAFLRTIHEPPPGPRRAAARAHAG